MSMKYKTTKDGLTKLITELESVKRKKGKVGAFNGDHAWLVGIHEYGCNIEVTPKMRAFLHKQGLHLKDSTTHIHIPERSFLRAGHDKNVDRIMKQTGRAISLVVDGRMSMDEVLDLYGQQMATAIKEYAVRLSSPPNHPYTIEQKGSSNPLVGTESSMIESITWKVE